MGLDKRPSVKNMIVFSGGVIATVETVLLTIAAIFKVTFRRGASIKRIWIGANAVSFVLAWLAIMWASYKDGPQWYN